MAKFVDETERLWIQTKLQNRLSRAATVIIAGPGLGQTDECSAVVTAQISGKPHHQEFNFSVGDRSVDDVVADLNRQILMWIQRVAVGD